MAKIIHLDIKNYRGIKHSSLKFKADQNLICLIGRGDSGKTTILNAISSALSPSWNLNFYDTDFYNCDHNENIEITVSLTDIPEIFLSENKFGLYMRGFKIQNNTIVDDVTLEELNENLIAVLTIRLTVGKSLEPQWVVTNTREQEDKPISSADRAHLSCYMISDYVDRHFSWNKGNPLYALLKSTNSDEASDNDLIVIQHLRKAKEEIDKNDFGSLNKATTLIKSQAAELGLDISKASTTLDSRELSIKDGRISLHEVSIPFRLKGKGSKRLASIAIQSVLVHNGGIMLIDEVEQGLEPDRVKQAARSLNGHHAGQIFITTHSRDAIAELGSKALIFFLKDNNTDNIEIRYFDYSNEDLQKTIRACPEAFFAKKVIICEGATEVGICRAMDKWRKNKSLEQMSFNDCAYVDGTGNTIVQRINEINEVGIKTALFCDSDLSTINEEKPQWRANGVSIFDCEDTLCLEQQVFKDLKWDGVKCLLQYAQNKHSDSFDTAFSDYISNPIESWHDTPVLRSKIISEFSGGSSGKKWFKAIHHGEALGEIVFKHVDETEHVTHLKTILTGLSDWIDEGDG
ncbi:MAG: AAA family ATPase [Deltaproteobacteria bacterium]|nr:AAA family ATPase [Deltaproteobacteria bacterium]